MGSNIPDGPFTRASCGLTRSALAYAVRQGEVRRLGWGTYVGAHQTDSIDLRARALHLVVPSHSAACRSTAAWLYGVDVLRNKEDQIGGTLEVAVVEGAAAIRRPGVKSYVEILPESDIVEVAGLRATSPLRTATDLIRWLGRYHAIGAADAFLRSGLVTVEQLIADEQLWFGFRGVRQLRELIRFADPSAESPRESWLRLLLHDAGFPGTELQVPVDRGPGLEPYRLDLAIVELKVAFEYDGVEWHPPEQQAADDERRAYIRGQGWTLIVVRRGDLERPQRLVDAVGMFVTPVRPLRRGSGLRTGYVPPAAA